MLAVRVGIFVLQEQDKVLFRFCSPLSIPEIVDRSALKMQVDKPGRSQCVWPPFFDMSTNAQPQQQSLTPEQIPFTTPQVMRGYVTDTGKILPRKYTHLSAKQQRRVTKTIKHSRNMLLAQ